MNKKQKRQIVMFFGALLLAFGSVKSDGFASEQQQITSSAVPEISTVEEPQRKFGELLHVDQSRIASAGINSGAPFYATLQLKEAFLDWTITALNYQNESRPSEYFLVDMNKEQEGRFVGKRVTESAMTGGNWKLAEVWVISPRKIVLCIPRSPEDEDIFSKFDFQLMKNTVIETGTEMGSLVERTELDAPLEQTTEDCTSELGAVPQPDQMSESVQPSPDVPITDPVNSVVSEADLAANAVTPATDPVASPAVPATEPVVQPAAPATDPIIPSAADPAPEAQTGQQEANTPAVQSDAEKITEEILPDTPATDAVSSGSSDSIQESSSNTAASQVVSSTTEQLSVLQKEQEALPDLVWMIAVVLLVVVVSGIAVVFIKKRK